MFRSKACHLGQLILVLGILFCDSQVLMVKHKGGSDSLVYDCHFGVSFLEFDGELLVGSLVCPILNSL